MNNNFNFSDISDKNISDAEETTNNSFGDKETKEMLFLYNSALCNIKDNLEAFKKSQSGVNDSVKQEKKNFKNEIKNLKNQLIGILAVKQVYDSKLEKIENEIQHEHEERKQNVIIHNPEILNDYVRKFNFFKFIA
jgi:hypothetical protein